MGKKLDVTPKIAAALSKATDGAVDPSSVAIFETISLNTLPINKKGLFNKAVVTEHTLNQMAAYVNEGNNVPLHTMHQQGSELPVGKTFSAEMFKDANGTPQLRTLFYLPNSQTDLINGLEADTINEVSVGLQTTHINCSSCGWDYRGADATWMNLYDGTCANDHVIGQDGVHVILNGLDRFLEQSLVSLGAANGAKIQSRTKALMGAESYAKLAASGITPEITVLNAVHSTKEKAPNMEMSALIASLTDAKASTQVLTTQLAASTASLTEANTALAASQAEVVALKALGTPDVVALTAARDAATATAAAATAVVHAEASRLCVALSLEAPAADATLEALKASIDTNRVKMAAAFPVNGVLQSSATGSGDNANTKAVPSSFKGA